MNLYKSNNTKLDTANDFGEDFGDDVYLTNVSHRLSGVSASSEMAQHNHRDIKVDVWLPTHDYNILKRFAAQTGAECDGLITRIVKKYISDLEH